MISTNFKELTSETWKDFEKLFGERGACGGCWCMYWRLTNKEFEKHKGSGNKALMKKLIDENEQIGIIMYLEEDPIGWCSIAPRKNFIRLGNSRILKPVDDKSVWSIVCFFIDKKFRRQGLSVKMLEGVIQNVKKKGAKILEGYPNEPQKNNMPAAFAWTGISSAFTSAGFKEVARRSKTRPIMRYYL